jgi:transcriptional regulator with XRE-family HTH domain
LRLTQTEIAKKLTITLSSYYKIESEKTKLDFRRLLEISEVLEVDIAYFLNKEEHRLQIIPNRKHKYSW